jgi:hypothetical protein
LSNVVNRPGFHGSRPTFEVFAGVAPAAWGVAVGRTRGFAWVSTGISLTRNGMLSGINNDIRLMVGAQWIISFNPAEYWWITAPLSLQWNFYLSQQWSVSLEAGLSVDVFVYDFLNCYDHPRYFCDRVFFSPPSAASGCVVTSTPAARPAPPRSSFASRIRTGVQVGLVL